MTSPTIIRPDDQEVTSVHDTTTIPAELDSVAQRRCWRCLQMFPGDAASSTPALSEFWLCDPCDTVLLPSKQRAT